MGNNRIQYLDTTNDENEDEVVAWDVTGAEVGEDKEWVVDRIIQVKTYPDKDNERVSYVTKTTYSRKNLPEVAG